MHGCARLSTGDAYCWGENSSGQLGDGTNTESHLPVKVLLSHVAEVQASNDHSCARTDNGDVYCWGDEDYLGIDATRPSYRPIKVPISGVEHLVAGINFTCASTATDVYCWGSNAYAELGRGNTSGGEQKPDVIHNRLAHVKALRASMKVACALTDDNDIFCWGDASYEGHGPNAANTTPTRVVVSDVADFGIGEQHVCVLTSAGAVICQGEGTQGALGDGVQRMSSKFVAAVDISAASPAVALAVGGTSNCAIMSGGSVKCWGQGTYGRLGLGDEKIRLTPTDVPGITSMDRIVSGVENTCVWNSAADSMYCWGYNTHGEVGDGSTANALVPQRVRF